MFQFAPGRCGRRGGAARSSTDAVAVVAWRCLDSCVGSASSLIPFGRMRGMLLVQHRLRDGRMPLLLRELLPSIDLRYGRCIWLGGSIVCDLSRPQSQMGDPLSLKPWQQTLLEWAPILRDAIKESSSASKIPPILPYTVAEFPADAQIVPRPTVAIEQIAHREGIPWQEAWERLSAQRSFPEDDSLLYDTRLCDRLKPGATWPGAVALYHDLRDVPMADHLEEQALLGIPPNRCGRIWIHTHPGSSPHPSLTDEQTFDRCFSGCDWSVMAILARGGDSYARLQIQTGPGAEVILPVEIDWPAWPRWVNEQGQDLPHLAKHWQHALQSLIVEPPAIEHRWRHRVS